MADPVFHLQPMGRLGNLMIEYMVALKFADMVRDCRISNISIPEWNIDHPVVASPGPTAVEQREQHIDLPGLADQVWTQRISRVEWTGFGQRMENFLLPRRYDHIFRSPFDTDMGFGPEYLVCPIRAEDILHGPNRDYPLTPMEFYRDVVAMTGLQPVFIGQTEPNPYMDGIRAAFPDATYRPPQAHPLVDFETIRQSRNLVIGVSTYSWVAAWLSLTAETIHLAVNGLFNPMQQNNVDLLPFDDVRFKFWLFPVNYALPLDRHAELHRRIAPYWRLMPPAMLRRQFSAAPRFPNELTQALAVFDEAFYLQSNADVAALGPGFARTHYANHGFHERRLPMRFDPVWYASQYPLAGFEVAQGDYADCAHHYIAAGKARGYGPCPPET